ncbi:MAG: hypothetical protein M0Z94_04450 [Dehalococcoidales bacterium]|nr:hypothetical protein [Dehalococcoidales bacterium]
MAKKGEETGTMLRRRFDWLRSFSDDELRRIAICETGDSLDSDEQYFDLSHPEEGVMSGRHGHAVPEGACYVPRSEVSRETWQKLTSFRSGGTELRQ